MANADPLDRFPSVLSAVVKKILVVGGEGQLGWELRRILPKARVRSLDLPEFDIRDEKLVTERVAAEKPTVIINAAAFTAVDRAEEEKEKAFAVNAEGAAKLAAAAKQVKARMIQISTDFVFDGKKGSPYKPEDEPAPLGVYGASKLEGEKQVAEILGERALIIRTAWLYSAKGSNFVKTMLRLMEEGREVRVVSDQVGSPTWAATLARAVIAGINNNDLAGVYHWTDAGVASWYELAVAIGEEAVALGLLREPPALQPISTEEYQRPARRPPYSVLDKTSSYSELGLPPILWRVTLRAMLTELTEMASGLD
jgi:dTDP-4-dehydrorhamnose reductase